MITRLLGIGRTLPSFDMGKLFRGFDLLDSGHDSEDCTAGASDLGMERVNVNALRRHSTASNPFGLGSFQNKAKKVESANLLSGFCREPTGKEFNNHKVLLKTIEEGQDKAPGPQSMFSKQVSWRLVVYMNFKSSVNAFLNVFGRNAMRNVLGPEKALFGSLFLFLFPLIVFGLLKNDVVDHEGVGPAALLGVYILVAFVLVAAVVNEMSKVEVLHDFENVEEGGRYLYGVLRKDLTGVSKKDIIQGGENDGAIEVGATVTVCDDLDAGNKLEATIRFRHTKQKFSKSAIESTEGDADRYIYDVRIGDVRIHLLRTSNFFEIISSFLEFLQLAAFGFRYSINWPERSAVQSILSFSLFDIKGASISLPKWGSGDDATDGGQSFAINERTAYDSLFWGAIAFICVWVFIQTAFNVILRSDFIFKKRKEQKSTWVGIFKRNFLYYVMPVFTSFGYLIVLNGLFTLLACEGYYKSSPSVLLLDPTVECWQGSHLNRSLVAMITFGAYFPFATVTPFQVYFVSPRKQIFTAPYYVITVQLLKCLLAIFGVLLAGERQLYLMVAFVICINICQKNWGKSILPVPTFIRQSEFNWNENNTAGGSGGAGNDLEAGTPTHAAKESDFNNTNVAMVDNPGRLRTETRDQATLTGFAAILPTDGFGPLDPIWHRLTFTRPSNVEAFNHWKATYSFACAVGMLCALGVVWSENTDNVPDVEKGLITYAVVIVWAMIFPFSFFYYQYDQSSLRKAAREEKKGEHGGLERLSVDAGALSADDGNSVDNPVVD
jgi:hypothetical protein